MSAPTEPLSNLCSSWVFGLPRFVHCWDLELHQVLLPPISFPWEATVYPRPEYPSQPHFTSFSSLAQCSCVLLGCGGEQWVGGCVAQ